LSIEVRTSTVATNTNHFTDITDTRKHFIQTHQHFYKMTWTMYLKVAKEHSVTFIDIEMNHASGFKL